VDFTQRSADAVGGDRRPHHTFRGLLDRRDGGSRCDIGVREARQLACSAEGWDT